MSFCCDRCGFETCTKKHLIQHLNRKIPCEPVLSNFSQNELINAIVSREIDTTTSYCQYCNKSFNTRQGKSRHQIICKRKQDQSSEVLCSLQRAIQELSNKIKTQESMLSSQNIHNSTITNNTNINSNNKTNISFKIDMREFGNENMEALPDRAIRDNIIFLKFIDILEMLHFDDDFPENRNFKLVSLKNEIMQFYKDKKWQAVSIQKGIDDIILNVCKIYMNFYYHNKKDVIDDMGEDDALKLLEDLEEIYKLDKKHVKDIRKDIKALLYNYKSMVIP